MIPPEVDVFVGNYIIIDQEVYDLWIQGYSVSEAVAVLQQRGVAETWGATLELLTADTGDQYRTFGMLEKLLINPGRLAEEWTFQLDPPVQKMVLQKYYDMDDVVIREIIGKKLTGRTRKDLDDIADKTRVMLRSCRRQFDNIKRIYKQVEEMPGSVITNIQNCFRLSLKLAQKYAAIIFIIYNKFETSKRRLNYLTFDDLYKCAIVMMSEWTVSNSGSSENECDIERDFLVQLRDLKVMLEREKEHRNVALSHIRGKIPDRMCSEVENNFKVYSRALINIACCLNNSRDLRDFFIDTVEKIIDPAKQYRWRASELEVFLQVYTEAGSALDVMSSDSNLKLTWERYMKVMQVCVIQLFHS